MSTVWPMRALLSATLAVIGLAVGLALFSAWTSDQGVRRVAAMSVRLDTMGAVEAALFAYQAASARVATGESGAGAELQRVKIELERVLARLNTATRNEIATLGGMAEVQEQLPQLDQTRRLVELFHAIDAAMNDVSGLVREGQGAEARQSFERNVAFRVDNELRPLLAQGQQQERADLARVVAALDAGRTSLVAVTLAVLGVGLALIGLLFWQARRTLRGQEAARLRESAVATDAQLAQLRETNQMLRNIDRRRGQILADVSHELRTPLTILRGEADVALRGAPSAEALQTALQRVQEQAGELGLLLDDLLALARNSQDDQPLLREALPIGRLMEAAAQEADVLAGAREVTIAVRNADLAGEIDGDFRRLRQALLIGLDNAIKHAPPGSAVTLGAAVTGGKAQISITDSGAGIAEDDLPHVFERFFRGRGGDGSLREGGIGIGLAIARDIVERHGGSIALANRPEGGAVLTIELPLVGGEAQ